VVALSFGGMVNLNGGYGASIWSAPDISLTEVVNLAEQYANGYYQCTSSDYSSIAEVALTTNNSLVTTTAAGTAWANMVNSFATWLGQNAAGAQVEAAGGNDIEPDFSDPGPARNWVSGYASTFTRRLINTGSADGCPYTHIPSSTDCGTPNHPSWGPEDIYYVSWGASPSWPVPEIYLTDGTMAQQWYYLSLYSVNNHGTPMYYLASATQYRACQHRSCGSGNNSVSAGYTQLYNALAQSSSTAQTPAYATDFEWYDDAF
jgi:hypothetical protein